MLQDPISTLSETHRLSLPENFGLLDSLAEATF